MFRFTQRFVLINRRMVKNKSCIFILWAHPHRTKMQPVPKSFVLQGFFGFLERNFCHFFSTFFDPSGLELATFCGSTLLTNEQNYEKIKYTLDYLKKQEVKNGKLSVNSWNLQTQDFEGETKKDDPDEERSSSGALIYAILVIFKLLL